MRIDSVQVVPRGAKRVMLQKIVNRVKFEPPTARKFLRIIPSFLTSKLNCWLTLPIVAINFTKTFKYSCKSISIGL